jgi:DNA-binding LacI/PurR family transcriptional regulator
MATIRMVAERAAVSTATVSRVLNKAVGVSDEVRQRVMGAAEELGYATARGAPIDFVGLVYTGRGSIGSPFDTAVLMGATAAAEEAGVSVVVMRLEADRRPGETAEQLLQRKGIRAAILRTHADTRSVCTELAERRYPSVVVADRFDDDVTSFVYADSRASSYQAVEHLISSGHRRIAIAVSHVPDHDHAERLAGYEHALKDYGIELDPKLIYRVWAMRPNGEQVMKNLLSLPDRPTALFITDPMVAVGAINHAHAMGVRIPDDVSIIGFDDTDVRNNVYPRMSAICQDARQLGYEAMIGLTRQLLVDPSMPVRKILPTWLELHRTTGQPPVSRTRVMPDGTRIAYGEVLLGPAVESAQQEAAVVAT